MTYNYIGLEHVDFEIFFHPTDLMSHKNSFQYGGDRCLTRNIASPHQCELTRC